MQSLSGLRWEPAIYEHKAALIGRSPLETSRSADLLFEALCAEHRVYGADVLTVGIDIYNLEAEACGAQVRQSGPAECPDIVSPLFELNALPEELDLPDVPGAGRFQAMLAAAQRLRDHVAGRATVRVAASGPVSIAAKLAGAGELVLSLAMRDGRAERLLRYALALSSSWVGAIRRAGLEVSVFDSLAAPPIFSPALYATAALPLHCDLMTFLAKSGQAHRPLVLGGDTTSIAARLAGTGANGLVCDFPASAREFARALEGQGEMAVRRNVRPSELEAPERIAEVAARYAADLARFATPIAGTGILPYRFEPSGFLEFRKAVDIRYGILCR